MAALTSLDLGIALPPLPVGRRVAVITNGGAACWSPMSWRVADPMLPYGRARAVLDDVLPPFWSHGNPLDMVASAGGDVGPRVLEAVAGCPEFDALIVLSVLGVPNTGDDQRPQGITGEYDGFRRWESLFLELVARLMESTGKPIINVSDVPIRQALFPCGRRYTPVVLPTPRSAALVVDTWPGTRPISGGANG